MADPAEVSVVLLLPEHEVGLGAGVGGAVGGDEFAHPGGARGEAEADGKALQQAGESVSPAALSGGIWEALLTTAAGLVVAIPCIAALHFFERRLERLQTEMESALTRLFTPPVTLPGRIEPSPLETLFGHKAS